VYLLLSNSDLIKDVVLMSNAITADHKSSVFLHTKKQSIKSLIQEQLALQSTLLKLTYQSINVHALWF